MNKYTLAILAVIFFALVDHATAGTVTKVNAKKKQVTIDQGKDNGIEKDAEICFTDDAGKKITCGTVKSVKAKTAIVKIKSKKGLKKIKEGTTADPSAGGEAGGSEAGGAGGSGKPAKFMAIRVEYLPTILSQAVYNQMTYLAPEDGKQSTTLWEPGAKYSTALFSIGLEFDFVSLGVAVGVRPVRTYKVFEITSDYTRSSINPYVKTSVGASALGFYLDYNFLNPKAVASGLRIGAGLDVDISTVNYKLDQLEDGKDTKVPLYKVTSKLTVISLRIPVGYELNLGSVGLDFGTNLMIPVSGDKATAKNEITDPNTNKYAGSEDEQAKAASDDLSKSLGHTKNSFAVEFVLGAFFAF